VIIADLWHKETYNGAVIKVIGIAEKKPAADI